MPDNALTIVKKKISAAHSGDKKQLEVIFSAYERIIVEAPAGYGKTKTMVSKIAYILASGGLPNPKKILALTFSVNAAYKIKKDVAELLPELLYSDEINPVKIGERVFISNYHGFCRHVLKLYGYMIHENLRQIDVFKPVDESLIKDMTNLGVGLTYDDAKELSDFSDSIKNVDNQYFKNNWESYLSKIETHLLTNHYITYNSIILYTIFLFKNFPNLLEFYQCYFPIIIVDEFQDTNLLSFHLLSHLISKKNNVIFIGDGLQRIYGFIGAIRDLMGVAERKFKMKTIKLNKNYRFKDNPSMLLLDKNLRKVAENPLQPGIEDNVEIELKVFDVQELEAKWVVDKANEVLRNEGSVKIAILVRSRGGNSREIIKCLDSNGTDYFYGLYRDDDTEYIQFHKACYNTFIEHIKTQERVTKLYMKQFNNKIKKKYKDHKSSIITSLLVLLNIFLSRLVDQYRLLNNDDKIRFCLDTFENRALRQQMEYVNKDLILTTVHGAKGLEWDYVILPDMEQSVFPMYPSLCKHCVKRYNSKQNGCCIFNYSKSLDRNFIEELSVFYVAVTRAKKQVFFSASKKRINVAGNKFDTLISCFLSLPGICLKDYLKT